MWESWTARTSRSVNDSRAPRALGVPRGCRPVGRGGHVPSTLGPVGEVIERLSAGVRTHRPGRPPAPRMASVAQARLSRSASVVIADGRTLPFPEHQLRPGARPPRPGVPGRVHPGARPLAGRSSPSKWAAATCSRFDAFGWGSRRWPNGARFRPALSASKRWSQPRLKSGSRCCGPTNTKSSMP